jgi:hypothetical protein
MEWISSASETRAVAPNPELEMPLNAQTSLISSGVDEVVKSPATPPVAESSPLPTLDDLPNIDDASRSINIDDDDEASTMDSKQCQIAEQRHADMDVDEELLSLIGDDLPSRGSQTKSKKHEFLFSEGTHSSRSPLPKQESTLNTLTSLDSSPVVTAPALAIKQERASVFPTDTTVGTRDSGTSAVEERPPQKKKAKHHPQPKSRVKPSGLTKTKPKTPSDGLSAAPFKSKKLPIHSTKKSALASRSRSTSAMPTATNSVLG